MKYFSPLLAIIGFCFGWQAGFCSDQVFAQCSEVEVTATFILEGILLGEDISIENMFVTQVGETTNPTEEDMIASIPIDNPSNFPLENSFGPFFHFRYPPWDWGGYALIDSRNGDIAFCGNAGWWGGGSIIIPASSNFGWAATSEIAVPPNELGNFPNPDWRFTPGDLVEMNNRMVNFLLGIDVLVSFGECGPYRISTFLYPPNGQRLDGGERGVVIVNGHCGPPWGNAPVGIDDVSWGSVKALYR